MISQEENRKAIEQFAILLSQRSSDEILSANIERLILAESLPILKQRIHQIIQE